MLINNITTESFFETISFADLSLQEIELIGKHFDSCRFDHCDFSNAVFSECTFTDCCFTNCNLSLVRIPHSQLSSISFTGCKMVGIDWTAAEWRTTTTKKKIPFAIAFDNCILDYSIFMTMNLYKVRFGGCSLREVGFEGARMECADFTNSDLSGALFADTELTKADFSVARNYTINACRNKLTQAKFSMPEATALLYALDIRIE